MSRAFFTPVLLHKESKPDRRIHDSNSSIAALAYLDLYRMHLRTALLKALGANTVAVGLPKKKLLTSSFTGHVRDITFAQDSLLILPDKKLCLTPQLLADEGGALFKKIPSDYHYHLRKVDGCHFEGGNLIYAPERLAVLQGWYPAGYHKTAYQALHLTHMESYTVLRKVLLHEGVELVPVLLKNSVDTGRYYHLDTYMQRLPDGRLLLLSKNMLKPESYKALKDYWGEDLIDLNYEAYNITPCMLNFTCVPNKEAGSYYLVSHELPQVLYDQIRIINKKSTKRIKLTWVTPQSITHDSGKYCSDLAGQVAEYMQRYGYLSATAKSLGSRLPKNCYYKQEYQCIKKKVNTRVSNAFDDLLVEHGMAFHHGDAGIHCLYLQFAALSSRLASVDQPVGPYRDSYGMVLS
jgi:N-dimethylarginine dimethylaminohydrolase